MFSVIYLFIFNSVKNASIGGIFKCSVSVSVPAHTPTHSDTGVTVVRGIDATDCTNTCGGKCSTDVDELEGDYSKAATRSEDIPNQ
jgi:hypothetical protein